MTEVNTTEEALGESSQLNDAPAESAVETVTTGSQPENLSLKEMNEFLGKDFKDKGSALKAIKDTFSYVGKKREDIVKEVSGDTSHLASELKQIKENLFYKENPELAEHRALISKLGDNPEVVAGSPEFQAIFSKAKGYDESQKLRTVLESNPRITASRDNISKAKDLLENPNTREQGENAIARAVLESIGE